MTILTSPPAETGRLRDVWIAAHASVPGVPQWARIAALAIPFTVLPSAIWRIAVCTFHLPIASGDKGMGGVPAWLPGELYVVLLSIVSEAVAFTAVGLIAAWGEVFPRWMPWLHGRRVPVSAAVIPAVAGSAALTALWTPAMIDTLVFQQDVHGRPLPADFPLHFNDWQGVLAVAAYVPLVAWGPLLALVTFAYYRRRTRA